MKTIILFLSFIFLNSFLFSQTTSSKTGSFLNNVILPSPTSAAFAKYGDIPVDLSTGIPNIEVPLYKVNSGSLSLPISLTYHSSGHRVEEEHSWVGLGWVLNGGGVVTRTMKGLPDDQLSNGYFYTPEYIPAPNAIPLGSTVTAYNQMKSISDNIVDSHPDVFSFNFAGKSGKFYINKQRKAILSNKNNLKVELIQTNVSSPIITGFIITDEIGIKYYFGGNNATETTQGQINTEIQSFISTWHINKIEALDGSKIEFTYEQQYYKVQRHETEIKVKAPTTITGDPQNCQVPSVATLSYNIFPNIKKMKKIIFSNGWIDFISSGGTEDIHLLQKISIYTLSNQKIKHFNFSYMNLYSGMDIYGVYKTKIGLNGVTEGNDIKSSPPYLFEYESGELPPYNSNEQDLWGFYNGNGATTLIPQIDDISFAAPAPEYSFYSGTNRNANSNFSKRGMLKKMTYPTGGYSTFEYEGNTIKKPIYNEALDTPQQVHLSIPPTNSNFTWAQSLVFESSNSTILKIEIQLTNYNNNCIPIYNGSNNYIDVVSPDANMGMKTVAHIVSTMPKLVNGVLSDEVIDSTPITSNYVGYIYYGGLGSKIKLVLSSVCNPNTVSATMTPCQITLSNNFKNEEVGGLRIKKITNFKDDSMLLSKFTEYKYVQQDGILSSGSLSRDYWIDQGKQITNINGEGSCSRMQRSSNQLSSPDGYYGNRIFYERVEEYQNGMYKTVTEFLHQKEENAAYLLKQTIYKSITNVYSKLKQTENTYEFNDLRTLEEIKGLECSYRVKLPESENGVTPVVQASRLAVGDLFYVISYTIKNKWIYLKMTKDITYDSNNESKYSQTKTEYFYDNPIHALPTKVVTHLSNTEKNITITKYPQDYAPTTESNLVQALINANIVSTPIEEQTWLEKNGQRQLLSGKIIKFDPVLLKPIEIYTTEMAQPVNTLNNELTNNGKFTTLFSDTQLYKKQASFQYNTLSKLVSQKKEGDIPTSYIWGYNNTLPIADVTNANVASIFHTSFEEDVTNIVSNNARTGTKYFSGAYTKALTGLTNGQYKLSYWTQSNNTWQYNQNLINVTNGNYTISLSGNIDEIRFYPANALMNTYTFQPLIGMTSQTDTNNQTIYYEYDTFQRLRLIKDEKGNILKQNIYHYKNE